MLPFVTVPLFDLFRSARRSRFPRQVPRRSLLHSISLVGRREKDERRRSTDSTCDRLSIDGEEKSEVRVEP